MIELFNIGGGAVASSGGSVGHDYNTLIQNGIFSPPTTTPRASVLAYAATEYNWLIDFNMNNFYGYFPAVVNSSSQITQDPPPASTFNVANVDCESWAIAAAARGVQTTFLTCPNEYGFLLYESDVNTPAGSFYDTYHVTGSADKNIMTKYVTEMRERGIEPGVYINCSWSWGIVRSGIISNLYASNNTFYNAVVNYYCLLVQEMYFKFGITHFWMDVTPAHQDAFLQACYNALRSVTTGGVMILNSNGFSTLTPFPADMGSTEEYHLANGATTYQSSARSKNGVNYVIPQEIVATPYQAFSEWYYVDDACFLQPVVSPFDGVTPFVKMQEQPISTYQGYVNSARAYNVPFLALMMIDRNGDLVQENLDFLDSIDFFP